jgi:hypothetical protein
VWAADDASRACWYADDGVARVLGADDNGVLGTGRIENGITAWSSGLRRAWEAVSRQCFFLSLAGKWRRRRYAVSRGSSYNIFCV